MILEKKGHYTVTVSQLTYKAENPLLWTHPQSDHQNIYSIRQLQAKQSQMNKHAVEKEKHTGNRICQNTVVLYISYYNTVHMTHVTTSYPQIATSWLLHTGKPLEGDKKREHCCHYCLIKVCQNGPENSVSATCLSGWDNDRGKARKNKLWNKL